MSHLILLYQLRENPPQLIGALEASFSKKMDISDDASNDIKPGYKKFFMLKEFIHNHPSFKNSCMRISHPYKKYATIIIPVFYDHLLFKNEFLNSSNELSQMLENIRLSIDKNDCNLRFKVKKIATLYFNNNLIYNINTLAGLREYITLMSKHNLFPITFSDSISNFVEHYENFKDDFITIMNDLEAYKNQNLKFQNAEYSMLEVERNY